MYSSSRKGNSVSSSNTAPSGLVFCVVALSAFSFLATNVTAQLPDSPGSITEMAQAVAPQNTSQQDTKQANTQQSTASPTQQSNGNQKEVAPAGQKPVGTAAAESVPTSGVAASQPAGTAIAPGKQRRTRSLVIKVGALVGAGIAVGTVAALTLGTSSKPPGAR
jgi:hypothetical protein